jgi:hypothetical protein
MNYSQIDFSAADAVRRPIQCEGITRGPERMTEIAASGVVTPQINWMDVIKGGLGGVLGAL